MNDAIDKTKPRSIEIRFRDVSDQEMPLDRAESYNRSVCDFFAIVQGYRDEVTSLVAASLDSKTGQPLDVDTLYKVWLSLAGQIVQSTQDDVEAMKIRRFVSLVLQRVQLDENLQRITAEKIRHPEKSESEIVQGLLSD